LAAVFLSGSEEANNFASMSDLKTAAMLKASEVGSRKISARNLSVTKSSASAGKTKPPEGGFVTSNI